MAPRRILFPTDLTKNSERTAALTRDIATKLGAHVEVLHVLESVTSIDSALYNLDTIGADFDAQRRLACEQKVSGWVESLWNAEDPTVEFSVITGVPHEVIVRRASEADHDWIIVGTHGRTGLARTILGSVAEKVIRRADRPVLTVAYQDEVTFPFRRILVPVDVAMESHFEIDVALDLARELDAELEFLHVWRDPEEFGVRMWEYLPGVSKEEFYASADESITRSLSALIAPHVEPTDRYAVSVRRGNTSEQIRHVTAEQSCDLIVLSAHRRSKIGTALFGSVSDRVVRTSKVPVLIVREP